MKETPLLEVKNLQKSFTVKKDSSVHPSTSCRGWNLLRDP